MIRSLIAWAQGVFRGRPWRYRALPYGGEYHPKNILVRQYFKGVPPGVPPNAPEPPELMPNPQDDV